MRGSVSDVALRLLRGAPDYRRLFLAALASGIGTWLAFVALVIDVTDRTEDARWVSALLVAEFLPMVVVGLLAAPLVDRLPRRGIMIAADVLRAAVFLALPFAPSALAIGPTASSRRPRICPGPSARSREGRSSQGSGPTRRTS